MNPFGKIVPVASIDPYQCIMGAGSLARRSSRLIDAEVAFGRIHDWRMGHVIDDEFSLPIAYLNHANVVVGT